MGVRQPSAGHKLLLSNHFYKPANPTILTCVIQHSCRLFTIIYTLPLCHLLFHQVHKPLPLTCQISTSHHQVLHILHFSTIPLLHNLSFTCSHLPILTSNLAVPLFNFARILLLLLHFTSTHHALHSFSINVLTSTICWTLSIVFVTFFG